MNQETKKSKEKRREERQGRNMSNLKSKVTMANIPVLVNIDRFVDIMNKISEAKGSNRRYTRRGFLSILTRHNIITYHDVKDVSFRDLCVLYFMQAFKRGNYTNTLMHAIRITAGWYGPGDVQTVYENYTNDKTTMYININKKYNGGSVKTALNNWANKKENELVNSGNKDNVVPFAASDKPSSNDTAKKVPEVSQDDVDKLLDVAETLTEHNAAAVVKKIMGRYDLFNNPESMLKFEVKIRMQDGGANDNKDNAIGNKIRAVS